VHLPENATNLRATRLATLDVETNRKSGKLHSKTFQKPLSIHR